MDLIMGRFADANIADLSDSELAQYEQLMDAPEGDLFAWVTGQSPVPTERDTAVFRRLRAFHDAAPLAHRKYE